MNESTVNTGIFVKFTKDGTNHTVFYSTEQLLKKLGADLAGIDPMELGIFVDKNGESLQASVQPKEQDYPGITVDGFDADGEQVYLANAELPNETYPQSIAARLYAGYAAYEFDGPIAIVTHGIRDAEQTKQRAAEQKQFTKIVYVDPESAQHRPWKEIPSMPEHVED